MRKLPIIIALAALPLSACGHYHHRVVHHHVAVGSGYGQPIPAARIRVIPRRVPLRRSCVTRRSFGRLVRVCR